MKRPTVRGNGPTLILSNMSRLRNPWGRRGTFAGREEQVWPWAFDDHTRWTADGREQADSHRYKQCGNGVATPVARWVAKQLKAVL